MSELPDADRKIVDELNQITSKLTVLLLLPKRSAKAREAVVFCGDHPGEVYVKRVDSIRLRPQGGCIRCGTKSKADQTDEEFVRDRLPECLRGKDVSISIDETSKKEKGDRTDLLVSVETKCFRVTVRQKSLNNALKKINGYAEALLSRHGNYVDFLITQSRRFITFQATCKIDGRKSDRLEAVLRDWTPRSDPKIREKLHERVERSQISPYDVFRISGQESKPAKLVRKLVAQFANGAKPEEEKTFVGLAGKQRLLRIDFYYRELNLLVEVQSILHYKSIERFGSDAGFEQRVEYDKVKVQFWERELKDKGVVLKHIRGDANLIDVSNAVRQMVNEALQLRAESS
jgi:hypothetical protein